MKKKIGILAFCLALLASTTAPSYADGPLSDVASLFGSVTATIVDVPEGIVVYSLWRGPVKTSEYLAEKFGDSKGFQQNIAGYTLGIPTGFLFGIPYGAFAGAHHGLSSGWDKPFSTESYLVTEEK